MRFAFIPDSVGNLCIDMLMKREIRIETAEIISQGAVFTPLCINIRYMTKMPRRRDSIILTRESFLTALLSFSCILMTIAIVRNKDVTSTANMIMRNDIRKLIAVKG